MDVEYLIELCKQVLRGEHGDVDNYLAAEKICEHVLETTNKDDDEPATEEWAMKNKEMFQAILQGFEDIDQRVLTRGQMRKLFEVLGGKK